MDYSKVEAIMQEIVRVHSFVTTNEGDVQRYRVLMANSPGNPGDQARSLQYRLNNLMRWQDALTRRVLQLGGMDSGIGIRTTVMGQNDTRL